MEATEAPRLVLVATAPFRGQYGSNMSLSVSGSHLGYCGLGF